MYFERNCYLIFQVGLAVDDIKGIQSAAELRRLALQVIFKHLMNTDALYHISMKSYFLDRLWGKN